ncbi:hypothetical protein SH601_01360 [Gracilibacillus sp. S3-1-1]|uniref:Uncharacterized protein n=1 Tax=Gracilibacillus pellucidus TaxID=3095368 RepID=A0ACC6M102_9BACI|nr:hypothetical protein [Gracilibacillus sp. S3-1-1]MDX8044621.1 hypothetical protein [Gracilibacillus sp. S3-1-1]
MRGKLRRFSIGDTVRIKIDLQAGETYYDSVTNGKDVFTLRMSTNCGEICQIAAFTTVGYQLDIDVLHTYTDTMLEPVDRPGIYQKDVETIVAKTKIAFYRKKVDEALEQKLYEKDPLVLQKLVDEYRKYVEQLETEES